MSTQTPGEKSSTIWDSSFIRLVPHDRARSHAVAAVVLSPGATILRNRALATVVLPDEKGLRCDSCFHNSGQRLRLKRCSGCAEYWYCNESCQTRHWKRVHKFMCKKIPAFRASEAFQRIPQYQQTDSVLLSHLVAEHYKNFSVASTSTEDDLDDPIKTFQTLIPFSTDDVPTTFPMVGMNPSIELLSMIYSRFSNNNFVIHSHLNPVGHGVFPLASRLFNHSCSPNAIVEYMFETEGISLEVKVIDTINAGEEITIPYFDPALPYKRRQEICQFSYNFKCSCPNCTLCEAVAPSKSEQPKATGWEDVEQPLCNYVFPEARMERPGHCLLYTLPPQLSNVLHPDFLQGLSSTFRDASHDGPYELAVRSGLTLLALYYVLYPPLFPQTGMHCLELAKTFWNSAVATDSGFSDHETLLTSARHFLSLAQEALSIFSSEGDIDVGPVIEANMLKQLLD